MPSLYLLRHGQTEANVVHAYCGSTDSPLTPEGIRGLESVRIPKVDATIASPARRCVESARIVGHPCPDQNDHLREVDFGTWEGKTFDAVANSAPEEAEAYLRDPLTYTFPGGESLSQLGGRIGTFTSSILNPLMEEKKHVLIISHGGPIRMLILTLMGMDMRHFWNFDIRPGRVAHIRYSGSDAASSRLIRLNAVHIGG